MHILYIHGLESSTNCLKVQWLKSLGHTVYNPKIDYKDPEAFFKVKRIAQKNNIQFRWNEKFPLNSLNLMRGYLFIDEQIKNKFFDICFDSYWKDNVDITQDDNVKKILSDCNIDEKKYLAGIKEIKIKEKLKNLTSLAFKNDVFGAPTFVVNDKLFWGQDRLEYALDEYNS